MSAQGGAGLSIDRISVMRDGERWFPVMGEYHFSRDLPERWEHELQKMKAGGINTVATYLIWIMHEEQRGHRRWDAHLDVRRFVETARRVGLEVVMRIGPWAHGEARNGGFPDWLQRLPIALRTNDPDYLDLVRDWFEDVSTQLHGLFRTETTPDGPIIAVQVDNELYDQPEHLASLRELAEAAGMSAPFWVATGWGGAQVPLDVLVPVYGGYSDGFWEESDVELPAFSAMHFAFSDVRDDLSIGGDVRDTASPEGHADLAPATAADDHRYPFITCELGGGMTVAYHRRPRVDSADVGAVALTKLGSGSAWQGYYLYHGTAHRGGELTGMHESHDSAYPNDMPQRDYDFFAPIGTAGTLRPHYHLLRAQHLFLQSWGAQLVALPTHFPAVDAGGLRTSVRVADGRGYVFGNNHAPAAAVPRDVSAFHFDLDDGLRVPSAPIRIPAGAYFLWPVRQRYGDVLSLTGTVQPLTQVETGEGLVVVFSAIDGIDVELDIDPGAHEVLGAAAVDTAHGRRWVADRPAGPDCVITVGTTRLVLLDPASSAAVWAGAVAGCRVVALWPGGLTFEADELVLDRWTSARDIHTIPAVVDAAAAATTRAGIDTVGPFSRLALPPHEPAVDVPVRRVRDASGAPEIRRGGPMDRFSAPLEHEFARAAVFEIDLTSALAGTTAPDTAHVLSLEWSGDVARAFVGDELVSDQFWYGRAWQIDVRHLARLREIPLRLEVLPWNGETEFFVDARVRPQRVKGRATIDSVLLLTAPRQHLSLAAISARERA